MTARHVLEAIHVGRPSRGPQSVHIDVTNGCNTNCVTCWDHSVHLSVPRSAAWKRARLEARAFVELLDDIASLGGLDAVVMSGMGEPFTHPDVYTMIEAVKSRGLHLTIITNLVAADAARIVDLGVDQLLIGVHAASEAAYLAFHPSFRDKEWNLLNRMLETFASHGRRFKHVQVVSRVNAGEVVDMVRFADRYRAAQVNFKLASLREGTEAVAITASQRAALVDDLVPRARELARELGVTTNLDVFGLQLSAGGHETAPIAEVGCFMGYTYARVLVDGTVLYCCNTDVRVGTLARGARFSDLWNGPAWNALRDRLRQGEYFSSCGQCGKLNQNVKIGRAFAERYGDARFRQVTGADGSGTTSTEKPRRLPLAPGGAS